MDKYLNTILNVRVIFEIILNVLNIKYINKVEKSQHVIYRIHSHKLSPKNGKKSWMHCWLVPVILAMQEAEIRRITV
jgi:hypothetical protein